MQSMVGRVTGLPGVHRALRAVLLFNPRCTSCVPSGPATCGDLMRPCTLLLATPLPGPNSRCTHLSSLTMAIRVSVSSPPPLSFLGGMAAR